MNKVKFEKDGQSIPVEDFAFEGEGIREGFYGLLSGFGIEPNKSFILSGCETTVTDWMDGLTKIGDTIDIVAGYISLNGEILKVEAQSINVPTGEECYFQLKVMTSHTTPVKVQGGADFYSQEKRIAELVSSSAPPTNRMKYNARRIEAVLRNKVYHKAQPIMFNPSIIGESMSDYFNLSTGLGIEGGEYEGWAMMDGRNGTPDWREKFVAGYNKDNTSEYDLGSYGGEKEHTLTEAEMPSHSHSGIPNGSMTPNNASGITAVRADSFGDTGSTGGDQPHENRPPYVVAAWIVRIA